jgi:hypothetical protein
MQAMDDESMKKSDLLRGRQTEIQKHNLSTVHEHETQNCSDRLFDLSEALRDRRTVQALKPPFMETKGTPEVHGKNGRYN